jgi:hypothetical protein
MFATFIYDGVSYSLQNPGGSLQQGSVIKINDNTFVEILQVRSNGSLAVVPTVNTGEVVAYASVQG